MIHSQIAGTKPLHWDSASQDHESLQLLPPGVKPRQLLFGCGQMREQFVGSGGVGAMKIRRHKRTFDPRNFLFQSQNLRLADLAGSIKAITGGGVDSIVESSADHDMEQLTEELRNPGGKAVLLSGASARARLPGGCHVLSVIQGDGKPVQQRD